MNCMGWLLTCVNAAPSGSHWIDKARDFVFVMTRLLNVCGPSQHPCWPWHYDLLATCKPHCDIYITSCSAAASVQAASSLFAERFYSQYHDCAGQQVSTNKLLPCSQLPAYQTNVLTFSGSCVVCLQPLPDITTGWRYAGNTILHNKPANIWQMSKRVQEKVSTYTFYTSPKDGLPMRLYMMVGAAVHGWWA